MFDALNLLGYPVRASSRAGWVALAVLSLAVGSLAVDYTLLHPVHTHPLTSSHMHHLCATVHSVSAPLALMLGPWQFLPGLRRRHRVVHRYIGWSYAAALFVSGLAALL